MRTRNSVADSRSSSPGLLEVLDVGDDDLSQLDFGEVHALAKDDRHEEVEGAREDVELEVQVGYRHEGQSSPGAGRGHGVRPQTRSIVRPVAERERRGDGESSRPHALDIYERICEDTAEELSRPEGSLFYSALFAGLHDRPFARSPSRSRPSR